MFKKVKKVAFAPGSCPLRVGKGVSRSGGVPFRFLSFREGGMEGPSNRSTTHPRACAPVACALFGGHD